MVYGLSDTSLISSQERGVMEETLSRSELLPSKSLLIFAVFVGIVFIGTGVFFFLASANTDSPLQSTLGIIFALVGLVLAIGSCRRLEF